MSNADAYLTPELKARFAELGEQDTPDAVVVAHYFGGSWDWWATSYDPQDRMFFGLVQGLDVELGYFALDDLRDVRIPLAVGTRGGEAVTVGGIPVERDLDWRERPLREVRAEAERALYGRERAREDYGRRSADWDR